MDFDELKALSRHQRQSFGRQVMVECYRTDAGWLSVTHLHDDVHDMEMGLLVDPETLVITCARGRMERFPFGTCPFALESLPRLEGMAILGKGILKEAHRRIPREEGCTHLTEMLEATLRALFAFVSMERTDPARKNMVLEEKRHLLIDNVVLGGSCLSFSTRLRDPEVAEQARVHLQQERDRLGITANPRDPLRR